MSDQPKKSRPNDGDPRSGNGAEGSVGTESDDLAKVLEELALAQRQRDENLDQLQRTRAEFANYQKRSRAQAEADRLYAIVPLAQDVLAVLDNFERANEAARATGAASIVEGLDMVHKQLLSALGKHGI